MALAISPQSCVVRCFIGHVADRTVEIMTPRLLEKHSKDDGRPMLLREIAKCLQIRRRHMLQWHRKNRFRQRNKVDRLCWTLFLHQCKVRRKRSGETVRLELQIL